MKQPAAVFTAATAIAAILFTFAFIAAPKSCEGGFELYFGAGIVALVALFALPFVMRQGRSLGIRFIWAAGFLCLGVGVWIAGLAAANVRFLCRLF